jgi:hypothetical protein
MLASKSVGGEWRTARPVHARIHALRRMSVIDSDSRGASLPRISARSGRHGDSHVMSGSQQSSALATTTAAAATERLMRRRGGDAWAFLSRVTPRSVPPLNDAEPAAGVEHRRRRACKRSFPQLGWIDRPGSVKYRGSSTELPATLVAQVGQAVDDPISWSSAHMSPLARKFQRGFANGRQQAVTAVRF